MKCNVGDVFECKPNLNDRYHFIVEQIEGNEVHIKILESWHKNWKIGDFAIWDKVMMFDSDLVEFKLLKEYKILQLLKAVDKL